VAVSQTLVEEVGQINLTGTTPNIVIIVKGPIILLKIVGSNMVFLRAIITALKINILFQSFLLVCLKLNPIQPLIILL